MMMRNFRLGLLLVSVAVMVIFMQQNIAPVLPLTFLGMKTLPLALCLWILLALAAGGLTSWLMLMLLKLQLSLNHGSAGGRTPLEYTAGRSVGQTEPRESTTDRTREESYGSPNPESSATGSYGSGSTLASQYADEFEAVGDRQFIDDDDDQENWVDEPIDQPPQSARVDQVSPPKTDYEVPQKPITNYQSGSVYSYSYQSPENTGVGTTESVKDAEYRVIVPPSSDSYDESLSEDYASEDYASEDESLQAQTSSSTSETTPEPTPELTPEPTPETIPVYKTEVQPVRSAPTKIQTEDQEDDWSKPSRKNNDDDWV